MKKSIFFIISLFLLVNYSISAQGFSCATEEPAVIQHYSSLARMENGRADSETEICINIAFHVVMPTESTGDHGEDIQAIINKLDEAYAPYNIYFVAAYLGQKENVDIIRNSNFLDVLVKFQDTSNTTPFDNLIKINHDPNAINVYLVDRMHKVNNGEVSGRGLINNTKLVIMKSRATEGVISHEIGHCLNLFHTHKKRKELTNNGWVYYPETKDNCTYEGDFLCDTPPDHDLSRGDYVSDKCQYQNGQIGYNPDTENVMSYTLDKCLNHFTNGQALRMRDAIVNNENLASTINCNCAEKLGIVGKTSICTNETITYSILCGSAGQATFKLSNNLDIVSSTAFSVTVKPKVFSGEGLITATYNGIDYKKYIWIGRPSAELKIKSQVNYVFMELVPLASDFETQNVFHIEWETVSASTQGSPYMGTAINQFENMARGTTENWSIEARIFIQNECGALVLNKTIQPEASDSDPCGYRYEVNKTAEKEFAIFKIINPCEERTTTKREKVKDEDIKRAILLDMFGNQLRTYQGNNFNVEGIKEGVYLFKIQVGNGLITQKIIIE